MRFNESLLIVITILVASVVVSAQYLRIETGFQNNFSQYERPDWRRASLADEAINGV
jgi:hypothetical protein